MAVSPGLCSKRAESCDRGKTVSAGAGVAASRAVGRVRSRSAPPRRPRLPESAGGTPAAGLRGQRICKPGSVRRPESPVDGHSSRTGIAAGLKQPTRTTGPVPALPRPKPLRAVPIRSCSRWGLPCRSRCRSRGALLPHPFSLAGEITLRFWPRRSPLCGTVPGVAPAGNYPAPSFRGARTFLPRIATAATVQSSGR